MTAQAPEELEIYHPRFAPGAWSAYAVVRGEPSEENFGWGSGERVSLFDPGRRRPATSANWKGYTETYRLTFKGRLVLARVSYGDGSPDSEVDEELEGDFYLVLKSEFDGPRLYVPFRKGTIVEERARWLHYAYTGNSPVATELRPGPHPDFPRRAKLWWEVWS